MTTEPGKKTEIKFKGGKKGDLDLNIEKDGKLSFTFKNSNK